METLKNEVEKTVRKFYGFGSNIAVENVEVQFGIRTQTNGVVLVSQAKPTEKRPYKRKATASPSASKSLHRGYTTSAEDIAVIRHFFAKWERDKKLTPDQSELVDRTKGVRYPMLEESTKTEMLRLFETVRGNKLFEKREENATEAVL